MRTSCFICNKVEPETWGRISIGRFNDIVCKDCYDLKPNEVNALIRDREIKTGVYVRETDCFDLDQEQYIYHYPKIRKL